MQRCSKDFVHWEKEKHSLSGKKKTLITIEQYRQMLNEYLKYNLSLKISYFLVQ